ncbi:MAG: serine/threonine-protein kinase [Kofleriaceae bacterium]
MGPPETSEPNFGPFVLREELGRGAMAIVYRAESRKVDSYGRTVALKRLHPDNDFEVDFDLVRAFIEEAHLATRFDHPNIAKTHSLGKADGSYFIEMEYVNGPTLHQLARQCRIAGAMPIGVVIRILVQICDALEHVHNLCDNAGKPMDLVHRDVSLTNIIVGDDGVVKLIDFGIVKGHSQARTEAGLIKGKLAYVAPEYLAGALDRRADLFAVGVIAHELLTSNRLFYGKNDLDTLTRLRQLRIPCPSRSRRDVPPALDDIVMRALERAPDQRWQTAAELRAALVALDTPLDPATIHEWISWAFACEAPKVSQMLRVLDSLDVPVSRAPTSIEVDLETQLIDSEPVAALPTLPPAPRSRLRAALSAIVDVFRRRVAVI